MPSAPGARGVAVVGVATLADRVGVVVRPDAAQPWRPGRRLPVEPVMVARRGGDVAGWVTEVVLAVRLAVIAATTPSGVPPVAVPRPLAGGFFEWHPLIAGALLATPGLRVELVAPRWVGRACKQRLAAGDPADPPWARGYPPELIGRRERAGAGMRQAARAAWDVAGAAGLRLAARGGEAA
jgi:hypothetical protein